MLLFFTMFVIMLVLTLLLLIFSEIKIIISNFEFTNISNNLKPVIEMKVGLYFLGKIKLFTKKIKNTIIEDKSKKKLIKKEIAKIKNKKIFQNIKYIITEILKKTNIENTNLIIYLDTKDAVVTSYIVAIISTIISNILSRKAKKLDYKKHRFKIIPMYKNQNLIFIKLNCIISIKVVHIINMYMIYNKNEKGCKNERPSYRRVNVNCYGEH